MEIHLCAHEAVPPGAGGAHTGEPRSQSPDIPRAPSTAGLVLIRGPAPGMSSSVDNVNLNPVHRSGDAAHRQGPWRPATLSGATTTSRAQVRVLGMRQRQAGWWTVQGGPAGHPRAPGTKAQQGHSQEALPPPATSRDTPVLDGVLGPTAVQCSQTGRTPLSPEARSGVRVWAGPTHSLPRGSISWRPLQPLVCGHIPPG